MTDATDLMTVQAALAAVMAEMPSIGKNDKSPEGYAYRGIEAVTKHVQPLFAKYGVVMVPQAEITDIRPSPAMKEGWTDVFMRVAWTITGPDGSQLKAQTIGIGRDRADKGANKAMTQAFKYLLLDVLCIADSKDDSDSHNYDQGRAEPPADGPVSERWVSSVVAKCEASGLDLAVVVDAATGSRTDDPMLVLRSEADRVKQVIEDCIAETEAPVELSGRAQRMQERVAAGAPEDVKARSAGGE